MLELVVLTPAFGMRNVSPFCLKLEMLLTSLELPFKMVEEPDPRITPKGKLPYLIDKGTKFGDSEIITEYLDQMTQGGVYQGLTPAQKAQGVALARLAEDHLYWLLVASRWLDNDWWSNVVAGFFGDVPALVRPLVTRGARKQVQQTLNLQGLGKHTLDEQQDFAKRDLQALEDSVPTSEFLFGSQPGIYDFTVAAIMTGILDNQPATWLTHLASPYENLAAYTERVQQHTGIYARK